MASGLLAHLSKVPPSPRFPGALKPGKLCAQMKSTVRLVPSHPIMPDSWEHLLSKFTLWGRIPGVTGYQAELTLVGSEVTGWQATVWLVDLAVNTLCGLR